MLDKINKKEAINFLKQKIVEAHPRITKGKQIYKQNQRIMTPWYQIMASAMFDCNSKKT